MIGKPNKKLDPKLMTPLAKYLFPNPRCESRPSLKKYTETNSEVKESHKNILILYSIFSFRATKN